jgi:hypothetical protein
MERRISSRAIFISFFLLEASNSARIIQVESPNINIPRNPKIASTSLHHNRAMRVERMKSILLYQSAYTGDRRKLPPSHMTYSVSLRSLRFRATYPRLYEETKIDYQMTSNKSYRSLDGVQHCLRYQARTVSEHQNIQRLRIGNLYS